MKRADNTHLFRGRPKHTVLTLGTRRAPVEQPSDDARRRAKARRRIEDHEERRRLAAEIGEW